MVRQVQYQIRAEPVLPESLRPETTLISKWYQAPSEPVRVPRAVAFAAVLIATSGAPFMGDPDDVFDPAVFPYLQTNEPVRVKPRATEKGWSVVDPRLLTEPETTLLSKWYQPASEPHPGWKPSYTWVYSAEPAAVLRPLVSTWFMPASEPVRVKGRAVDVGYVVTDPQSLTQPETTLLSKWFVPASEPVRIKPPLTPSPYFVSDPKPPVVAVFDPQNLEWHRQAPPPVRVRPRATEVGWIEFDPRALTQPETTLLTKWYQPPSEPVRARPINPAALLGGTFETVDILPAIGGGGGGVIDMVPPWLKHRYLAMNILRS